MVDSQERVRKALESAESLLASLLDRASLGPAAGAEKDVNDRSVVDIEQSLLGVGEKQLYYKNSTHQAVPFSLELTMSPRDTLTAIVTRSIQGSSTLVTDNISLQDQLSQKEKELDITAKIGLALLERKELLEKEVTRLTEQLGGVEQRLAQARHELGRKESLLQLYYVHEEQEEPETQQSTPEWVQGLSDECSQLKESNQKLWFEKVELEQEAQKMVQKERALVQQCFDQLTEAKQQLIELQTQMEQQVIENEVLEKKVKSFEQENRHLRTSKRILEEEFDDTREAVSEAQIIITHLSSELLDWQEKYDTCYAVMQDAQEEVKMWKELSTESPSRNGIHTPSSSEVEHGSIVEEIEAVLRQEIIAASTLPERPPSPSTYARQRTMVVMETVKAATLATARKLEKLAADQRKKEEELPHKDTQIMSESSPQIDNPSRLRQQKYFSPQKLQIVKPMEGSATLLQWKLLATPQLGGTSSFFSKSERPGIYSKTFSSGFSPGSAQKNLTVGSIQQEKRWHSVNDLSLHRTSRESTSRESPLIRHRFVEPMKHNENLSTIGQMKKGFWGLLSPSDHNQNSHEEKKGEGLEELLGP